MEGIRSEIGQPAIDIRGQSSSVESWRTAQAAEPSSLPHLDEKQKESAKKFGISEEAFARSVLAASIEQERLKSRGKTLVEKTQSELKKQSSPWEVTGAVREAGKDRWVLFLNTGRDERSLPIPLDLADDVIDGFVGPSAIKFRELLQEAARSIA